MDRVAYQKNSDKYLLLSAIVILSFSEGLKQILFGLPIVHIGNLICIFLFARALMKNGISRLFQSDVKPFAIWVIAFLMIGSIGALVFKADILMYLWGIRTYFRMFLLLFDIVLILEREDVDRIYNAIDYVVAIHFILTLIQFFGFGIRWDYLNGIFGTAVGDSSSLHAFLLIDSCLVFYRFFCKSIGTKELVFHFVWMAMNAAMSEIRSWFYEIIALAVIYLIFSFEFKRVAKIFPVLLAVYLSLIVIMSFLYPYTSGFLGVSGFHNIISESHKPDGSSGIGRKQQITAMTGPILEYANGKVEGAGIIPLITGLGLGTADYATIPFLNSFFFNTYENTGYSSFLLSFLYIETGIIGLVVFNAMWVYLLWIGFKDMKQREPRVLLLILCSFAMSVTAFYNQTLRTNYGYIMWVFLGTVVIIYNKDT